MIRVIACFLFSFLCIQQGAPFVATTSSVYPGVDTTSLQTAKSDNNMLGIKTASSALAAAFIFSNVMAVEPALASPMKDFAESSEVIAARSGGRMGGRSSMGTRSAAPKSYNNYRSTTVIRRSSPSVIVTPPMYSPTPMFGFPFGGGFGFGYGLGSMGAMGDSYRDYRQDSEIARDRAELEQSRIRQTELEQRIAQLEGNSAKQEQLQQQLQSEQQFEQQQKQQLQETK